MITVLAWLAFLSMGLLLALAQIGVQRKMLLALQQWQQLHNKAEQGLQRAKQSLRHLPVGEIPGVRWSVAPIFAQGKSLRSFRIEVVAVQLSMRVRIEAEVLLDNSLCYGDDVCEKSQLRQLWQRDK